MLYKIPSSIAVGCVTVTTSRGRLLKVSGVFHIPKGSSMTVSRNRILSLGLGQKCRTTRRQCVTPLAKVSESGGSYYFVYLRSMKLQCG